MRRFLRIEKIHDLGKRTESQGRGQMAGMSSAKRGSIKKKTEKPSDAKKKYKATASVSQNCLQVLSMNGNPGEFAVCGCSIVRRRHRTSEPTLNQYGVPETSSSEETPHIFGRRCFITNRWCASYVIVCNPDDRGRR